MFLDHFIQSKLPWYNLHHRDIAILCWNRNAYLLVGTDVVYSIYLVTGCEGNIGKISTFGEKSFSEEGSTLEKVVIF